jgi:hypothetical protein
MTGETSASECTILVASSSYDFPTWQPVVADLDSRGYDVIVYEADKVARGEIPFNARLDNDGLTVTYGNRTLFLEEISAAWYRRSTLVSNPTQPRAGQIGLDSERKIIQAALWEVVPADAWLNSPANIRNAGKKLTQLMLARELGFTIPTTVTGNEWKTIAGVLPEQIIFKPSYPVALFSEGKSPQVLYTTSMKNEPGRPPVSGNPFPGFWQAYVAKAREWRITAVGDQTFDAAIYTSNDAKDDWRKHQGNTGSVEFRKEAFPDEYKEKCIQYLGRLGLKFGAFDFIESPEGEIVFLECNANGQFGWLEAKLGLPISQAIADELAATAQR